MFIAEESWEWKTYPLQVLPEFFVEYEHFDSHTNPPSVSSLLKPTNAELKKKNKQKDFVKRE